jgi:indole-3-glycerol phosphate synthase
MNILDTIIAQKKKEVEEKQKTVSIDDLQRSPFFARPGLSMRASLLDNSRTGIIAEFKRKSPSKGIIHASADVVHVTRQYADNGASGLSVLTDTQFFGGTAQDLMDARVNTIPIIRKDFIVSEYQVVEARAMGADMILLIAACLSPAEVRKLASFAEKLGLEVLLELHDESELDHVCDKTQVVGINNRNLKTFEVDIERSLRMAARIPSSCVKVAESGISSVENILLFKKHGFRGFLIGENFMKQEDPGIAFQKFVQELKDQNKSTKAARD